MPRTGSRLAALALALLCLLGGLAVTPPAARAVASGAVLWHIDQRIDQARHEVHRWGSTVHAWRHRQHRAEAHLRRVLTTLGVPRGGVAALVGASKAHRWLGPHHMVASATAAVHEARRRGEQALAEAQLRSAHRRLIDLQQTKAIIVGALHGAWVHPNVSGPLTYGRWARALLASLGAPPCPSDLHVLVAWEAAESTPALFNPLATEYWMPGAWTYGTSRVDNYPSLAEGLQATRANLLMAPDAVGYAIIVNDLLDCAPAVVTASAIRASYWCHGCAGGAYVTGQLPDVLADWQGFSSRVVSGG